MYQNPVGYALGLLDELEEAHRAGRDAVAADVRQELAAVRGVLHFNEADVQDMSDEGKAAWASLRSRLAALDAGHSKPEPESEEPAAAEEEKSADEPRAPRGRPRNARSAPAPESAVPPPTK